jgi:hypothetical protein
MFPLNWTALSATTPEFAQRFQRFGTLERGSRLVLASHLGRLKEAQRVLTGAGGSAVVRLARPGGSPAPTRSGQARNG